MTDVKRMLAVRVHEFGGVEVLRIEKDVPVPAPGAHEVLVRVHAAGVGAWDALIRAGNSVLPQPLPLTPGSDFAGEVVLCGSDVAGFAQGDAVFGVTNARFCGAYAEYAVVEAAKITHKPRILSDAEAASIPVIACTAQQMLFDHAQLQRGESVLVLGGAGNVGAYVVQLAHLAGAHVIAVARSNQHEFVRSLGADEVIEADVIRRVPQTKKYDVVMDCVGGETLKHGIEWAKEGGRVISAVEQIDKEILEKNKIKGGFMLVSVTSNMLQNIVELISEKKIQTNIGEVLNVREVKLAHEMVEGKKTHKPGKIILTLN